MRVMIVDDSKAVRSLIASFIDDVVEEIVECEDGSEALATYSTHQPDMVLMDIKMKSVDGLHATREIKACFPEARVVIVSQWDVPALREAAAEAGAEHYVNKKNLAPLRTLLEAWKLTEWSRSIATRFYQKETRRCDLCQDTEGLKSQGGSERRDICRE